MFTVQSGSNSRDLPTAELLASFQPTISFYIGHSLNPTAVEEYVVLSEVWAQAAAVFGRHPYVASVVSDESICSYIADMGPTGILNLDAHEVQQDLRPGMLANTVDAAAVLMLCVRYIRTAAIKEGHQRGLTPDHTLASMLDQMYLLRVHKRSKMNLPAVSNVGTSPLSPHVALLRSAMLIIKAAILSPEVHGIPPKPYSAKRSLWYAAQDICAQVHASAMQASSQLGTYPEPGPLFGDLCQARQMSSLTVQLVLQALRQHLKQSNHAERQLKEIMLVICCTIMGSFFTATNSPVLQRLSQTVAEAMVSSGMPLGMLSI